MAASSTADLALDDIKKADEIISMAVLGNFFSLILYYRLNKTEHDVLSYVTHAHCYKNPEFVHLPGLLKSN